MTRSRRIAGLAALTALALSACASGDAKVSEVRDSVREAGATAEQADCVEGRFEDDFDQDQLNDIAAVDDLDELEGSLREEVQAILDECVGGESPSTSEEEGGEPSESDSSDTTEADGSTTTTAAETTTTTAVG
jgi:hypothetical protein